VEEEIVAHQLISCDDHMDLGQLPADLWVTRLPVALRDRAPHIEERDGQAVWICDGKVWGSWSGKPPSNGASRPVKPLYNAFDRAEIYDQSARRPAIAELRLADMDRDGVETQVIFGPIFQISTDDPALRQACYRVYNDWLLEFCAAAPDRLIGVPMLPETPDAATDELLRLAAAAGTTPAWACARASAASKSRMPCKRLRSENTRRMASARKSGSNHWADRLSSTGHCLNCEPKSSSRRTRSRRLPGE